MNAIVNSYKQAEQGVETGFRKRRRIINRNKYYYFNKETGRKSQAL